MGLFPNTKTPEVKGAGWKSRADPTAVIGMASVEGGYGLAKAGLGSTFPLRHRGVEPHSWEGKEILAGEASKPPESRKTDLEPNPREGNVVHAFF